VNRVEDVIIRLIDERAAHGRKLRALKAERSASKPIEVGPARTPSNARPYVVLVSPNANGPRRRR
jgi:hypothetical protein